LGTVELLSGQTDANGTISFSLPDEAIGKSARVTVQAKGYEPADEPQLLEAGNEYHTIRLRSARIPTPASRGTDLQSLSLQGESSSLKTTTPPVLTDNRKQAGIAEGSFPTVGVQHDDKRPELPHEAQAPPKSTAIVPGPPLNSYDLKNAQSCGPTDPLTISALRVERTTSGYETVVTLSNDGDHPASVVGGWPLATLDLRNGPALVTNDGLVQEGKYTFWKGQIVPDVFEKKFDSGLVVQPGKSGKFLLNFKRQEFEPADTSTLALKILILYKTAIGEPKLRYVGVVCTDAQIVK